jgi:hypothetical protein
MLLFDRSSSTLALHAWHSSLTIEQSNRLEHIQKRALSIIYGNIDDELFCVTHNIDSLNSRRTKLCREFFKDIAESSDNCLHYLLSDRRPVDVYNLRSANRFLIPIARNERYKNSFLAHALEKPIRVTFKVDDCARFSVRLPKQRFYMFLNPAFWLLYSNKE